MLPYVDARPVVPDAEICRFVFRSAETIANNEAYQGKRRYRLNNWQPIIDTFPSTTQKGLKFHAYRDDPLTGIVSTWTVRAGFNPDGTSLSSQVSIVIPRYTINKFGEEGTLDPATFTDIGVGFLRYVEGRWKPFDAMELALHRRVGTPTEFNFTTLENQPVGPTAVCNIGSAFRFDLKITGMTLSIEAIEYGDDGITPVAGTSYELVATPPINPVPIGDTIMTRDYVDYHIALFIRGSTDTDTTAIVARTSFEGVVNKTEDEIIYFSENPPTDGFSYPVGVLREVLPLIQQPHTAYIEDGDIQVTSPMTPMIWYEMMKFLVNNTIEPCHFYDIFGDPWTVCLGSLTGTGPTNRRGKITTGYTLTMPILVMH